MLLHRDDFAEMPEHSASDTHIINIDQVLAMLQRQARVLIIGLAIGLLLGTTYILLAPRAYLANALVLIDPNLQGVVDQVQQQQQTTQQVDLESDVLNQMQVVQSGRIARAVVEAQKLNTDAEFLNPPPSFSHRLLSLLPWVGDDSGPRLTSLGIDDTATLLAKNLHVERIGRSSVISVGYEAPTPQLATRIAQAYADAFEQDQLNADLEANRSAADWLQQRLDELGTNQRAASLAVEQYRQEHNLSVANSDTLSNQRLQALTSQLVQAQSDLARDQSLSTQLAAAVAAGPQAAGNNIGLLSAANLPNTSVNPDVSDTANKYAEIGRRIADVRAQFGPDHPQVKQLESEQQGVANQIFAMLKDLNDRYTNIVATDRGREETLRANVEREGNLPISTNKDQVKLSELQQHAAALKALYDSYLTRYEETVQRQSFPIPTVRIITPPMTPKHPDSPHITLTVAVSVLLGLCLGACFAAWNEVRERAFRVGQQVTDVTGLRFVGYLPRLLGKRHGRGRGVAGNVHETARRQIAELRADSPASTFTETLRASALLLREPHAGQGIVVGTVSALPGEGKTLFSVALAEMLASTGHRTLLIDADLRAPEASHLLAPDASQGLLDVARGTPLTKVLRHDEEFGLAILPLALGHHGPRSDFLSSRKMDELLHDVRKQFEYIVIDMPPVGPVVDALALLPMTDALFLVTEWGRTPRRLVKSLLGREPQLAERIAGVVLNKVDLNKLPQYSTPGDAERYLGTYERYYRAKASTETIS